MSRRFVLGPMFLKPNRTLRPGRATLATLLSGSAAAPIAPATRTAAAYRLTIAAVPLQQPPRDQELQDLVRALAEDQERRVAVEALDQELGRVAVAAVDAHRLEGDLLGALGREQLGHPRLEVGPLAGVLPPGRVEHEQPRGLDLRSHLGELELDRLVLGDGLAEGLALARVADRGLEGRRGQADGPGCDVDPSQLDASHEVLEPLPDAGLTAEHARRRGAEAVEDELDRLDALVAELAQ